MPRLFAMLAASAALFATPVFAADPPGSESAPPAAPDGGPPAAASAPAPAPMDDAQMADVSAGDDTVTVNLNTLTTQEMNASSSGNTVTANTMTSGAVNFSAQALNGFNGIGNFVINTGANNTLQGAINLSIVTAPPL